MTAPETPLPSPPGMNITKENKLKGSLFIEAYGSLIDGIGKDAESETEKALDITFNAIGAASATVMLAIDPLGSIIGAGVGWLIEHVSFLRDALNQLMGNPEEIQANVEANKARAAELRVLAEDHKKGLATFDGWTGASSERFKTSMDGMAQELDELASAVETKAKIVAIMGMLVTVLRDIVRDLIAQLIGSLIGGAILAAAAMIPTFGASIAIFGGFAVGKAVALGVNIASRVARVVAALGRQMKRIGDLDGIMAKISKGWNRFENGADVAEIGYEGYKAANGVDKKIDEAVQKSGGSAGTPNAGGTPAQDGTAKATLPNAPRVGTVQMDSLAEPMQTARHMQMAEATPHMQPMSRVQMEAAEPMQAMHRAEAPQAPTGYSRTEAAQAPTGFSLPEAPQAPTGFSRTEAAQAPTGFSLPEAPQAPTGFSRTEAAQAPTGFSLPEAPQAPTGFSQAYATPMHEVSGRVAAQDSTMVSGVSMTSGTPVHQAVQPLEAREMYSSYEAPAEPVQQSSAGYEPMARTQMSHTFEALEPREGYNPLQAHTPFSTVEAPVEEGYNPLLSYEGVPQPGNAAAQPLRPAVAYERPTRSSE